MSKHPHKNLNNYYYILSVTCDRCGFFRFPPPFKTDHHDITEILLKVALNTVTLKPTFELYLMHMFSKGCDKQEDIFYLKHLIFNTYSTLVLKCSVSV